MMKKFKFGVAVLAIVLSVGSAFTTSEDPFWNVEGVGVRQGSESYIKTQYCDGADLVSCASLVENPAIIIRKP